MITYEKIEKPVLTTKHWTRNKFFRWRKIIVNNDEVKTRCLSKIACLEDGYYADVFPIGEGCDSPKFKTIKEVLKYLSDKVYKETFGDGSWHYTFRKTAPATPAPDKI